MSTRIYNEFIPAGKLAAFTRILEACGGSLLHKPVDDFIQPGACRASFAYASPTGYHEHAKRWARATADLKTKPENRRWAVFLDRFRRNPLAA